MPIDKKIRENCFFGMEIISVLNTRYISIFNDAYELENWLNEGKSNEKQQRVRIGRKEALWFLSKSEKKWNLTPSIGGRTFVDSLYNKEELDRKFFIHDVHVLSGSSKNDFKQLLEEQSKKDDCKFLRAFKDVIEDCSKNNLSEMALFSFDLNQKANVSIYDATGTKSYFSGSLKGYLKFMSNIFSMTFNKLAERSESNKEILNYVIYYLSNHSRIFSDFILSDDYILRSKSIDALFSTSFPETLVKESMDNFYTEEDSERILSIWLELYMRIFDKDSNCLWSCKDKVLSTCEFLSKCTGASSRKVDDLLVKTNQTIIKKMFEDRDSVTDFDKKLIDRASSRLLFMWADAPIKPVFKESIRATLLSRSVESVEQGKEIVAIKQKNKEKTRSRIRI